MERSKVHQMEDWTQIVNSLRQRHKMTDREISEACDCSEAQINRLRHGQRGKSLSYDIGAGLLKLHKEREALSLQQSSQGMPEGYSQEYLNYPK